jgi:hypothetical protein|tara:strand:- start:267 stop:632 length:366 start_codon:yes stop_codon:yes gene_type:complete
MPKPKPDQVIRHEIVFGRSERELIEGALVAYQVNKIATPLVALISDKSAMTLIFSIIGGYFGIKYVVSPGLTEVGEIYDDFRNQLDAAREAGVEIDVVGIGTDPSTYTDAFISGLETIFGG